MRVPHTLPATTSHAPATTLAVHADAGFVRRSAILPTIRPAITPAAIRMAMGPPKWAQSNRYNPMASSDTITAAPGSTDEAASSLVRISSSAPLMARTTVTASSSTHRIWRL